jgi:hypothetical protein
MHGVKRLVLVDKDQFVKVFMFEGKFYEVWLKCQQLKKFTQFQFG